MRFDYFHFKLVDVKVANYSFEISRELKWVEKVIYV
jgi:hypothetical protein